MLNDATINMLMNTSETSQKARVDITHTGPVAFSRCPYPYIKGLCDFIFSGFGALMLVFTHGQAKYALFNKKIDDFTDRQPNHIGI